MSNDLTDKEIIIVELVLLGLTNKEIARKMGISVQNVKNSISVIYDKLRVNDRNELILKFSEKFFDKK